MNSKTLDLLGWALPALAVLMAVGAASHFGDEALLLASAVLLFAIADRRRAKIVTTSLVRFVDEKGTLRGLAGWNGEGIQISVRTDPVYNVSIAHPVLWQSGPNVSFTFTGNHRLITESKKEISVPTMEISNGFEEEKHSYSLKFSYDRNDNKPSIEVIQVKKGAVVSGWTIDLSDQHLRTHEV